MPYFFARLVPTRPDFPSNMTAEEGAIMQRHSAFLAEQLANGVLVAAGPVLDPAGVFGIAVLEGESIDSVRSLLQADPASGLGSYGIAPMASAVVRAR